MARAHNNFKPRRSRRSGVKKAKQIKTNLEVLKKYLMALFVLLFIASCTTIKYVVVDPKDSTKLVEIKKRIIYDDYYMSTPSYPLYNNYWWWYNSRPIIIQKQPIIVPSRPQQPLPPRGPRPGFGPLPPSPRPRK